MTLFLDDGDVRLYHGDALEQLRQLPDGCVDMVATSPPFYGLRDYGIELNHEYCKLAADRLSQLSLLAETGA